MAVKSKEEILQAVKARLGDDDSDEVISLMEDISDTFDSFTNEDWKRKYEDNDREWRRKYKERFFKAPDGEEIIEEVEVVEEDKRLDYDDLFKKE